MTRIAVFHFSATGNTERIAKTIGTQLMELGSEVDFFDITLPSSRQTMIDFDGFNAALFGFPIHSMRAPRICREWITGLNGLGKKCAMFFTYGGFQVHPAHHTTRKLLEQSNFKVVASAEFLASHTYNLGGWKAMEGRPDESDFSVAREYAERVLPRFTGEDPRVVGKLDEGPYTEQDLDAFERSRYKMVTMLPTREGLECQMCGLCEELCPTSAIDMQTGRAYANRCIACLRCVKECPDQVLKINDVKSFYFKKRDNDGETEASLKSKKSRMYL
jgi:ferredoxin/flavodoxin